MWLCHVDVDVKSLEMNVFGIVSEKVVSTYKFDLLSCLETWHSSNNKYFETHKKIKSIC